MLTDGNFDQASARIRAIQYIPLFEKCGYSVSLIPRIPLKPANLISKYIWFPLKKRILWLRRYFALYFCKWDVIFIQRIFIAEFAMKKVILKSKLIFDFDDAIYLNSYDPTAQKKTEFMVRYAHHAIISTPWLNDFCLRSGKNGEVIPTPVETDLIHPSQSEVNKIPVIGWIGSSWTTDYLKPIEPVLEQLSDEIDFEFLTVGAKPGFSVKGVNHKNLKWEFGIEPKALARMDIGIMPLPDDDYARAKGGYKLYLYMAAGIPSVASPIGVNNLIIRNGENGFLANSESDWYQKLKLLVTDKQRTKHMGENSRHQAVTLYDRKVCFSQLINIIEQTNP